MPADTNVLIDGAKCIEQCIPGSDLKLAVLIKLFSDLANVPSDTASLLAGTECIQQCIPGTDLKLAVLISLVSQINSGGAGAGFVYSSVGNPNGQVTANAPALAYDDQGRVWAKTGSGNTGWEQLIGP